MMIVDISVDLLNTECCQKLDEELGIIILYDSDAELIGNYRGGSLGC